jgi:DNA invertase Pin-like site-specific DNA recombinase
MQNDVYNGEVATGSKVPVVGYLRVSTDAQAEHGFGLRIQEDAIRAWAKSNGARLVAVYGDEGVSGSNGLDTREALPLALRDLRERRASGIVVYRLDRLARDLVLQETLLAEVRRMGADVFSTSAAESGYLTDDPDDPSRKMIRQILGAVSEYERGMIKLRLRSGRLRKAQGGGYAFGSPPYGQRSVDGVLLPVDDEQSVLARMKQMHASGTSLRRISEVLNAEGVPAKRSGSRWHPTTVARALAQPARQSSS